MIEKDRKAAETIERLLQDRIIFLGRPIDDEVAHDVLAQMLFLLDRDSQQPISIYINSPGGSATAGLSILDGIDNSTSPIETVCVGIAGGTALLVLAHGAKGHRFALPHAQFQMTKLRASRQISDEIRSELERMEELTVSRLAEFSGQPKDKVRSDLQDELSLDAHAARSYGLIDDIIKVQGQRSFQQKGNQCNQPAQPDQKHH
jgi:ATP-dependent Clp protease protease subunit